MKVQPQFRPGKGFEFIIVKSNCFVLVVFMEITYSLNDLLLFFFNKHRSYENLNFTGFFSRFVTVVSLELRIF